ncbi:hypothetical protein [Nocardia sp. alder85J]|uniref:hypothetical protein n=1 Tax=Nocardia sp. alder85J TaxID=2862949 RepID=UPI001CD1D131|nr:hypothetical protein [Nocardia sp. alder85J]MCX4096075.1 hypothetical protein [Nocardia sp. alder85J]
MRQFAGQDQLVWIDYAEFGPRFVGAAVTPERIEAAVAGMTGRGITIGPFSVGPVGLAGFVAEGKVGKPVIAPRNGPEVEFGVRLPASLHVTITLGGQQFRLEAIVDIALTLRARAADPLLIVIDVPPVEPDDVDFTVRAQAIGGIIAMLLDPITVLIQREVAARVNGMLDDPQTRRARIFDIAAILDGRRARPPLPPRLEWLGYDEFGRRFFPRIVTADRVREVVEGLAGRVIEVGPLRTGPGAAATVQATGVVRMPRVAPRPGADPVSFDLTLPVELDLTIDALVANRYRANLTIPLVLIARAAEPLLIVIDVAPPTPEQIQVDLRPLSWRAKALGVLGGIRGQLATRVAAVVRDELRDLSFRSIDVAARIAAATD